MLKDGGGKARLLHAEEIDVDLVVVGGGLAGVCAAITAAREGIQVCLVQDRPMLGGNSSSEVRLWILGATSHMGNNNRWAREGGVLNELLLESAYRNPEGNPLIFDTILLEKVVAEPNLRLLLNTAAYEVTNSPSGEIQSVTAFCSQNSTQYQLRAPLFCDASGDGVVGFLAGAAFRIGAESRSEFGEAWAPEQSHQQLLGHSLYFYTRDTGIPTRFVPPAYALEDISKIPRYRQFNTKQQGCQLWWIEYGGSLDTVHDTETIKWELWKIVYGVWNHIKNSGHFPESETLTLEWVGQLPGKRESRRFEGDYMLTQQDVVEQRTHEDAVSYGGWAVDLHPVDAIYSDEDPCTQWHSKGVYQIPYRCMYSRNVPNLFLAGRIISATHLAFGSTRVMGTCAHNGQAVGVAAAICHEQGLLPAEIHSQARTKQLQSRLLRSGQYIPGVIEHDPADLVHTATIEASSELQWTGFRPSEPTEPLVDSVACLVPLEAGDQASFSVWVTAPEHTPLTAELRTCSRPGSHTLDKLLETITLPVPASPSVPTVVASVGPARPSSLRARGASGGADSGLADTGLAVAKRSSPAAKNGKPAVLQEMTFAFTTPVAENDHVALCLVDNEQVNVALSEELLTGVTTVWHQHEAKVAKSCVQEPPAGIGFDSFAFWTPRRRPRGKNLAFRFARPLKAFGAENIRNGYTRPYRGSNAWVADPADPRPTLRLGWQEPRTIGRIELSFDVDYDHALEQVLMRQPETVMPYCVRRFRVLDGEGRLLFEETENYLARSIIELPDPVVTDSLVIEVDPPSDNTPASLFEVRCYEPA